MRVETTRAVRARRSGAGLTTGLITGFVVFLVVSLVSALLFILSPTGSSVSASFLHPQPGSLPWDRHERLNVLLMASDRRTGSSARTDIMMIASYDPAARSLTLLSLPGNLWVTIPGFEQAQLSEAYADGGPHLALLTVESVTHVAVPYYAMADAAAVERLVDALGGATVPLNGRARHLTGPAALQYLQATYSSGGDRTQRAQQLLLGLVRQLSAPQMLLQIPTIVNSLGGAVPTNAPYDELPLLARALMSVPPAHIHLDQLDTGNATVTDYRGAGEPVLLPDPQHIRALAQHLFPDPTLRGGPAVEVLNGAGVVGEATTLAGWLRQAGVRIRDTGSASSFNYPRTYVSVSASAPERATAVARRIAALLQAPLIVGKGVKSVVVVIGHDFQDPTQQ